jgi:acyl carrier protein
MDTNENLKEKEVFERIKQLIVERLQVDPDKITYNSSFASDLGADSLDVVELILTLEGEFKISITDEEAAKIHTIGEAITVILQAPSTKN